MMKYKIIENPLYTGVIKIGIECDPDNEPFRFLVSGFGLEHLPELISGAHQEIGASLEYRSMRFYGDLDGSDFADGIGFEPDEVGFGVYTIGHGVLKKDDFFNILCDYTDVVLAYYQGSPEMTEKMETDIRRELAALKTKIGRVAS